MCLFYVFTVLLWPPYVIGQAIIFLPCGFYLSIFFSSPNLSGHRLDVYHTSTHGVALVRIYNAGLKCAKLCGVEQRAPPIFGRAAITLGIGPHF